MPQADTTWYVTKHPRTGEIEIPSGLHACGDLYPSMDHSLGFIDGPEDDSTWAGAWLDSPLEFNDDGTAVRPEGSDEPWATLHED